MRSSLSRDAKNESGKAVSKHPATEATVVVKRTVLDSLGGGLMVPPSAKHEDQQR